MSDLDVDLSNPRSKTVQPMSRDEMESIRDNLIVHLKCGVMCPACAERVTEDLGLEPFETSLPLDKFDPMQEPFWTLPMAAAWLMWSDINIVREHWPKYLNACQRFIQIQARFSESSSRIGWKLEPRHSTNLAETFDFASQAAKPTIVEPNEARASLLQALQAGRLVASGISAKDKSPAPIPSYEWTDETYFGDHNCETDAIGVDYFSHEARYRTVRVPLSEVLCEWPELVLNAPVGIEGSDEHYPEGNPSQRPRKTAVLTKKIIAFYKKYVEDHLMDLRPPNREHGEKVMRDEFGLIRDMTRQLRKDHAPKQRQDPGAPNLAKK
jgi:hypothetical protein